MVLGTSQNLRVETILVSQGVDYGRHYPEEVTQEEALILIDALHSSQSEATQVQVKSLLYRYPQKRLVVMGNDYLGSWNFPNHFGRTEIIPIREELLTLLNQLEVPEKDSSLLDSMYRDDAALLAHSQKIIPRYDLKDLILPEFSKRRFTEALNVARNKLTDSFESGWREKHQRGHNVVLVFNGPSGTGKTMGAEVVAKALNYVLYRIDYSSVQSKYIGEAEKSLKAIFEAARGVPGVLLFDEGDAIFATRSEGTSTQDRYSNGEVNFLLQELERFEGIIIISTNFEKNMDTAFMRRFTKVIRFPIPDSTVRGQIWKNSVPLRMQFEGDIDFNLLSQYELTGGEIRNALVEACLIPRARNDRAVTMVDLLWATKRECQKKKVSFEDSRLPEELGQLVAPEWEERIYSLDADPFQKKHCWNQALRITTPDYQLKLPYQVARKLAHLKAQRELHPPESFQ
jgi:SpoVK/Ycf46/Vps4 family AAA+-type ATPase